MIYDDLINNMDTTEQTLVTTNWLHDGTTELMHKKTEKEVLVPDDTKTEKEIKVSDDTKIKKEVIVSDDTKTEKEILVLDAMKTEKEFILLIPWVKILKKWILMSRMACIELENSYTTKRIMEPKH